jgi:hypothetical protein
MKVWRKLGKSLIEKIDIPGGTRFNDHWYGHVTVPPSVVSTSSKGTTFVKATYIKNIHRCHGSYITIKENIQRRRTHPSIFVVILHSPSSSPNRERERERESASSL